MTTDNNPSVDNGKPQATQEECLKMAQLGKKAWNEWQQNTPIDFVDFSGIDFETKNINFSNFIFESRVSFKNSIFGTDENCNFNNTTFKKAVHFNDCTFANNATFNNVIFYQICFFERVKFQKESSFLQIEFKSNAEFINCQFNGKVNFSNSKFSKGNTFINSQFFDDAIYSPSIVTGSADFQNCIFHKTANFSNIKIEKAALFAKTRFESTAYFRGVNFQDIAIFRAAEFRGDADFSNTSFLKSSNFKYTQFGGLTNFEKAIFTEIADFRATQFISDELLHEKHQDSAINFSGALFHSDAIFNISHWNSLQPIYRERYAERKKWSEQHGVSTEKLASTDFRGAQFNGNTSFQGRKFIGPTDFGPLVEERNIRATIFKYAPNFHECEFHQNTTFHKARFPPPSGNDSAARAYRTLKLAFSKKYDLRQEQNFYKLEMLEELKSDKASKYFISILFSWLSDFGFSIGRPLILILLSTILATSAYGLLADLEFCNPNSNGCDMFGTLLQFSLFAIPGFEKISLDAIYPLFKSENLNTWTIVILFIHKLIMLLSLFLLGLALRNLFKMK